MAHEAGHANEYREAIEKGTLNDFNESVDTFDEQYDNKEERRVITTTEQYAAKKHGEISENQVTRTNHHESIVHRRVDSILGNLLFVINRNMSNPF